MLEQSKGVASTPLPPKRRLAPAWERRYARKLLASDALIILAAIFGAQIIRFGSAAAELEVPINRQTEFAISYTSFSLIIAVAWFAVLGLYASRDPKVFGTGPTEYKRVANATLFVFGLFAILAFLAKAPVGRGYLIIALPFGLVLLILSRWLWRKRLHRQRAKHLNTYRTLIVGQREKSEHVAKQIMRDSGNGFWIVGAVTEQGTPMDLVRDVEVVGNFDQVAEVVDELNVDAVILTSTDAISPQQTREIGWELERRKVNLIVAAALTDIAGPRIHSRPVAGLPLIQIDYPALSRPKWFAKRIFDLFGSGVLLVLLSPIFLLLAVLVRSDSPGSAFFKQRRVGRGGNYFSMLKFRSMRTDAEDLLPSMLDQSDGNGVLFKMKDDPRVTKVGRFIRRYSLDELPQLVNVFRGEMSLVGPRPPLPREVDGYESWVYRKLLVKPGITGLWQVSGRSDLSWEDSIRLDLYYVENWSLTGDIMLLWKTMRAVARPSGAY